MAKKSKNRRFVPAFFQEFSSFAEFKMARDSKIHRSKKVV
jgi:hypothetical protein